jgi:hypothetical protein
MRPEKDARTDAIVRLAKCMRADGSGRKSFLRRPPFGWVGGVAPWASTR